MESLEKYRPYIIKEYTYWTLFLHEKQYPYVGRCYAWWKDQKNSNGEGLEPGLIPPQARNELFDQMFWDVYRGCRALGYPVHRYGKEFLLNMCYLANMPEHNHHMHWHFIPRVKAEFKNEVLDLVVIPHRWGENYTYSGILRDTLESEETMQVRQSMDDAMA